MAYVITSKADGIFIGSSFGLAFFSGIDTAGQHTAYTEATMAEAEKTKTMLSAHIADLEIVEVRSGHWRALQEAGLDIADMAQNELLYTPAVSSDMPAPVLPALATMPVAGHA